MALDKAKFGQLFHMARSLVLILDLTILVGTGFLTKECSSTYEAFYYFDTEFLKNVQCTSSCNQYNEVRSRSASDSHVRVVDMPFPTSVVCLL